VSGRCFPTLGCWFGREFRGVLPGPTCIRPYLPSPPGSKVPKVWFFEKDRGVQPLLARMRPDPFYVGGDEVGRAPCDLGLCWGARSSLHGSVSWPAPLRGCSIALFPYEFLPRFFFFPVSGRRWGCGVGFIWRFEQEGLACSERKPCDYALSVEA